VKNTVPLWSLQPIVWMMGFPKQATHGGVFLLSRMAAFGR
jgi:hypothetical protein